MARKWRTHGMLGRIDGSHSGRAVSWVGILSLEGWSCGGAGGNCNGGGLVTMAGNWLASNLTRRRYSSAVSGSSKSQSGSCWSTGKH